MITNLRTMIDNESGATAVEYAIMVGLIAVVIVGAVTLLGINVIDLFTDDNLSTALS